jgi:hypothetical protein
VKTHKKTPIYRAAQREAQRPKITRPAKSWDTAVGGSIFMRRKLKAVKRELRTGGTVSDRDSNRSLMNVRATVNERYGEAINWLRGQGRDDEARRFELMHRNLPPVRSEKQLIADELMRQKSPGKHRDSNRDPRFAR